MKKCKVISLIVGFLFLMASSASAAIISLFDSSINLNGTTYSLACTPGINTSGFDMSTGLGTITLTISGAGSNFALAFFDHDIDDAINTFYNEYGSVFGSVAAGQSWEIDEPGYVYGDIWTNFIAGVLDNSNGVPSSAPDDVSMAMGWNFTLAANQYALLSFIVSDTAPNSGFYLSQTDPDSNAIIYFSSTQEMYPVPLPATLILLGPGLIGIAGLRWKFKK